MLIIFKSVLKKIRNFFLYSIIATVILIAVGLSAARVLLPDVQLYRSYVEEQLATILEHPVKIGDLNALITGITPVVIFHDVKLISRSSGKELLEIEKIKIGFSVWRSIKQRKIVPDIYTIDGVELAIIRKKDGKILIQDIDVIELGNALTEQEQSSNTELSEWLFNRSSLIIQNSSIVWHDKKRLTKPTRFKDVTLKLRNSSNRHQFNGEFILSDNKNNPKRLELALDVYGDMLDPIKWVGKFYANGVNIRASEWGFKPVIMDVMVEKGLLDFRLWGDWVAGELNKIEAKVVAHDVAIRRLKNNAVAKVKLLSGLIKWNKDFKSWDLSIEDLKFTTNNGAWPTTEIKVSQKVNDENKSTSITTDVKYFRIEDVRDLLLKSGYVENRIFKYLRHAAPSGELENIKYQLNMQEDKVDEFFLSAKVNDLSLKAYEKVPGFKKVSAELFSNHNSGVLSIKTKNAELDFNEILSKKVLFNELDGNVEWIKNDDSWGVFAEDLIATNSDASIRVSFNLDIPNDNVSPYLDLQSEIVNGKAVAVKNYLPKVIMTGDFKQWMGTALESGKIEKGGIILNGRLSDFPYTKNNGVFQASLSAKNITLNYNPGWPLMHEGDVDVVFTGRSMDMHVNEVKLDNSQAKNFDISIDDLSNPLVKVKALIKSNLDDVAQYSSSTFLKDSRDFVASSRFSGETNIDLFMTIPLSEKVEKLYPLHIKAKAFLINAELSTAKDKLYATNINGTVDFTKDSITARNIIAKIMGGASKVDIFTRHQFGGHPIRFVMQGNIDVSETMKTFKLSGYDKVKGRTDWQGVFTLKHKQDGVIKNPMLQVSADMQDIIIDLPPPMEKKSKVKIPTYMTIENVSKNDMLLNLVYGEKMSYALDIDLSDSKNSRLRRGHFRFKPEAAELPKDEKLLLTGSLKNFSLRDWLDALDATTIKKEKSFFSIPVNVDMDYLHLAKAKDKKPRKPSDPRKLPLFEGEIADFYYDTYPYGKFIFKTSKNKKGLSLDEFTIISPYVKAKGKAFWHYKPKKQFTEVTMKVHSVNYGNFLSSLGFSSIIENGVADFTGDFNWKGGFGDFSWGQLNGLVTMDIENGVFTKVDPGAGRLLGLLSIESLPSMLFTGDAFKTGFNFDRIVGVYEILDGNAYSDDVSIAGPVANILVTGRTGIVARDFDHYLTVVPNVSGSLTVPSTFAFGPQVGAVVYFFKKIFGSGIDESSQRIYHLTGTWDKPITTRIDKNDEKIEKDVSDEDDYLDDDN